MDTALHKDMFESKLPSWHGFDLTDGSYDRILIRSLLSNPTLKDTLLEEYEYLEETCS